MTTVPQTGVHSSAVSYTLLLVLCARRAAARLHLPAEPIVGAAKAAYRARGNHYDGRRAIFEACRSANPAERAQAVRS